VFVRRVWGRVGSCRVGSAPRVSYAPMSGSRFRCYWNAGSADIGPIGRLVAPDWMGFQTHAIPRIPRLGRAKSLKVNLS
jgi:hypothetical protein